MNRWRPENWPKCPCDDCETKQVDEWGYFCDIHCGKRSAWINFEAGGDAMVEELFKMAKESPTGTFIIDSKEVSIFTRGGGL